MTNPSACAFASDVSSEDGAVGLTKREYIAAMAMQGLLASNAYSTKIAQTAVIEADALINELNVPVK